MARMGRWIHITGWENGPLFDLSTQSILSVLEIENVQAIAPITKGTVFLNRMQHVISRLLIPTEELLEWQ